MTDSTQNVDSLVKKYAHLKNVVESGHADDTVLQRLIGVCVKLGKDHEAIANFEQVRDPAIQRGLRRDLERRGILEPGAQSSRVIAVTDAGSDEPTLDQLQDAVTFIMEGRMRKAVLVATLAFPGALVLGGSLNMIGDSVLVRVAALLPVLVAVCFAGVLWRHVMVLAVREVHDTDLLPENQELAREMPRIARDVLVLGAILLAPALALWLLVGAVATLVWLPIALAVLPITAALRLCGRPWRSLMPGRVVRAIGLIGSAYVHVAALGVVLHAPAMAAFVLTLGQPLFLVLSVVGPLAVVPGLVLAHLLGTTLRRARPRMPKELPWKSITRAPNTQQSRPQDKQQGTPRPTPDARPQLSAAHR